MENKVNLNKTEKASIHKAHLRKRNYNGITKNEHLTENVMEIDSNTNNDPSTSSDSEVITTRQLLAYQYTNIGLPLLFIWSGTSGSGRRRQ